MTEPYVFVPLTDPNTGLPAVLDQIVSVCPSPQGSLIMLADADMHLLVRETASEVLDVIADLYHRIERTGGVDK